MCNKNKTNSNFNNNAYIRFALTFNAFEMGIRKRKEELTEVDDRYRSLIISIGIIYRGRPWLPVAHLL